MIIIPTFFATHILYLTRLSGSRSTQWGALDLWTCVGMETYIYSALVDTMLFTDVRKETKAGFDFKINFQVLKLYCHCCEGYKIVIFYTPMK